jgi:outer membrane protein TolC
MYLKKFSLSIVLLFSINLFGNNILSNDKKAIYDYSKEKINEDRLKLKKDLLNPITYTYSHNAGDSIKTTDKSVISISETIFKSGGIYSAIKYANSTYKANSLSLNLDEKSSIKIAIQLLFQIRRIEYVLKQQQLNIENASIDIENKKDSVLNGILDISFLNNAILNENKQKISLVELEFTKQQLINNFNNLTAKSYKDFVLPRMKLLSKDNYIKNNLHIQRNKITSKVKKYFTQITQSKYMPSVNVKYSYTKNHTTGVSSNKYGFNIIIPFDLRINNDTQSAKLEYLKSKTQERITILSEQNFLNTQLAKIDMIDKKINLTKINIKSYDELLSQMQELENAGIKTKDDVIVFKNSRKSEAINLKIFFIDKQLEILELYARVTNAI